jgi:hypothetical protein
LIRFRVKEEDRKPDPEPIETNAALAVILFTLLWAVALLLILLFGQTLSEPLPQWWALTCVFGICLGIFGYFKVRGR